MAKLDGHVAVITGAAQGIGAELATGLARERCAVVIADIVDGAATVAAIKKDFWDIDEGEWDRVMRVNVRGVFQTTKAVLPSLRQRGEGSIINIGSGTMLRGAPFFMHYVTSKGAVLAMTRSIARELGGLNIRANCVMPSFTLSAGVKNNEQMVSRFKDAAVASRMLRRDMVPADIVGAVTFLASNDSNFITGQAFNIDGGAVTY